MTSIIHSQTSSDYDPSFVTEALKEIQYSDTSNQDIDMLKDVAAQVYLGNSAHLPPPPPISPSFFC